MTAFPYDNGLRKPTELYPAIAYGATALLLVSAPPLFLLSTLERSSAALLLTALSLYRAYAATKLIRYQRHLYAMPRYVLNTTAIPCSNDWLFLGLGFRWQPWHTQKLHQLKQTNAQSFLERGQYTRAIRAWCQRHADSPVAAWLNSSYRFNPFKPHPLADGNPFLHGVGGHEQPVKLPQNTRVGHTLVVGTTRVGKTRLASVLITQDIINGSAVIVVDPKGDLELVQSLYAACQAANRLSQLRLIHLGFPDVSCRYNPLKHFDQVSEVATRITSAMPKEGEGQQFAAFAWKYVNLVASVLNDLNEPITYQSIAFYLGRLEQLLMHYADDQLPKLQPDYQAAIDRLIKAESNRLDKQGNPLPPLERPKAIIRYLKEQLIHQSKGELLTHGLLVELLDAAMLDKAYYDKITASVGPFLAEINSSNASTLVSGMPEANDIELMQVIKTKQVLYIGLDSLTNPTIAEAVGKALLADLVSTAGKLYKSNETHRLNFHCDELAEVIQDAFVKMLNKGGGAGFQITAYTQTKQDLEASLGSRAKAEVTEGNFNTLIMLRVKNEETAKLLVNALPQVEVLSPLAASQVSDLAAKQEGVYFNTTNEDRMHLTRVSMLEASDLMALPKGHAFVLMNGNELYKVRLPLAQMTELAPADLPSLLQAVNPKTRLETINTPVVPQATTLPPNQPLPSQTLITDDPLTPFKTWLVKRIQSEHPHFALEHQHLVVSNTERYGEHIFFIREKVLTKYQQRRKVSKSALKQLLLTDAPLKAAYFIEQAGHELTVIPLVLPSLTAPNTFTTIIERDMHVLNY